jgi:hypothetical protein
MMPEESIATEEQLLGEVSAGDRRDEIDEAREHAALTQDIEFNPELLLDASDATND